MAFRGQVFAHQFEFGFGQCEAFDIIAPRTEGIRQHDFGGDLFQNRMADVALERIGRRLRGEYQHRIALAVSFEAILREAPEGVVAQRLPELVDADNHPLACQELVDPVKQIQHDRRANVGIVEKIGRSEEHTSELQSLMRISYAVFCLKKKKKNKKDKQRNTQKT